MPGQADVQRRLHNDSRATDELVHLLLSQDKVLRRISSESRAEPIDVSAYKTKDSGGDIGVWAGCEHSEIGHLCRSWLHKPSRRDARQGGEAAAHKTLRPVKRGEATVSEQQSRIPTTNPHDFLRGRAEARLPPELVKFLAHR